MMAPATNDGQKIRRPHFRFVVLAFGFLVLYNIFSWLPTSILFGRLHLGDIRLDWAIPAAVVAITVFLFVKDDRIE
jgi:hypothetical protein